MNNENQLDIDAARGVRAESLLKNELLTEAFKTLEDAYTAAWRTSFVGDQDTREKLFLAVNILGKVKEHISKVVTDGQFAQAELRQITEAAERKKPWHAIR